jgi:hypothetical protein
LEFVVGLEPIHDGLQGRIVAELKAIPQRPLGRPVLELRSSNGLREAKEWKGKIDESILVLFELVFTVNDL